MSSPVEAAPGDRPVGPPSTFLESGGSETGRYAEVEGWCLEWPRRARGRVRCERFGTTPEGRPLVALVAAEDKRLQPAATRSRARPVVLVLGGIHAGEIDGKDAGDLFLREWLLDRAASYPGVTLVFVPVFNVDGHERFGPHQRPNQDGPRQTGFRTTSANLNLNRDFLKVDAPEMRALLGLVKRWDPALVLDLHVTDGADFPADIAIVARPAMQGPPALRPVAAAVRDAMLEELRRDRFLALSYYPSFRVADDPASGVDDGDPTPRFSHGYFPLRGRVAVLVETHSWKPYARRVWATRAALRGALAFASREGERLVSAARDADAEARVLPGASVGLAFRVDRKQDRMEPFKAWAWSQVESEALGRPVVRYDRSRPVDLSMPFSDVVVPTLSESAPIAYVVPPVHAALVSERLAAHGVRFERLRYATSASVEVFRATKVVLSPASYEGRQRLELEGAWRIENLGLARGSLLVPVSQPLARVVVALLEPRAPDSLAAWGSFNAHFEQKEYLEPYVADAASRTLFEDPAVAAAFNSALLDPAFAASPDRRLDWIYRRHPSNDDARDRYPVVRLTAATDSLDAVKNAGRPKRKVKTRR